ncbi:MAG: iron ABC transporter permease [Meiothermus sp.]|uniref:FecCD family ABC transporter permease n=1 Tax=Meiothermus sp. TaxID=1955249 RepID=UPI00298EFFA3|nr:iron ABC transporter permease [Meiothermus sp.]MDW8426212.1 iron ABC transporter permease [Meiothermus sp.]
MIPRRLTLDWPLAVLLAAGLLVFSLLLAVSVGAVDIPLDQVWRLIFRPDASNESLIVHTLRLPRALVALLVGASLGVAGALMQGLTRNPLAEPGLLGVNAGAALGLLLGVVFFPGLPGWGMVLLAALGGVLAAALVYSLTAVVGLTPVRLALAGIAVGAMLGAAASFLLIMFEERTRGAFINLSGSLAGRTWEHFWLILPWALPALLLAVLLAQQVNLLSLGEETARSLGARVGGVRLLVAGLAVLLAGAAVSVAGPVGFLGLMVPHLARGWVGPDYRRVLPLSALLGASLLSLADVAARLVDRPLETPVGILVVALGAPFFVYLARRTGQVH